MSPSAFTLSFDELPLILPLFPLSSSTIMPGCQLPLNIFEPRYIRMIFDAMGHDRIIGLIQPLNADDGDDPAPSPAPVFKTGAAGRIISFSEAQDDRLLIVLAGMYRFDVLEELEPVREYRRARVDWSRFAEDGHHGKEIPHDRKRLFKVTREYFRRKGLDTNWEILEQMPAVLLVNFLCSQLPFSLAERQALIETVTPEERLVRLLGFMEFENAAAVLSNQRRH